MSGIFLTFPACLPATRITTVPGVSDDRKRRVWSPKRLRLAWNFLGRSSVG